MIALLVVFVDKLLKGTTIESEAETYPYNTRLLITHDYT
jgi:hypothetical protein